MNLRLSCLLLLALLSALRPAQAAKDQLTVYAAPSLGPGGVTLSIFSATDTEVFEPLIRDYQRLAPATTVRYRERGAQQLYAQFLAGPGAEGAPDLLISSAMDLQTKLVNDGYAQPHATAEAGALPDWARWREEIYGFSYEPVVLVYNTRRLPAAQVPRTHGELLRLLLDPASPVQGRIGTYDVLSSSVGYLLATQDAELGNMANALLTALGHNRAQLLDETTALLDRLESGQLLIGYNLLGSYAQSRIAHGAPLATVSLGDYTLAITRTVLIPKAAPHAAEAGRFVDYLLSRRGQQVLARSGILPIRNDVPAAVPDLDRHGAAGGAVRPLRLGPGLLVYLDRLKRRQFLEDWNDSLHQAVPPPAPEPERACARP
ncbi:ABC transporter substrate-binding protein [Frateuria defendens]|uniref:ABC transporter substrate-binding protein n=1 Tax=Frateuria defendens TaxID=2219559 RepID=UPI00066FC5BD|nr:ABC transporter substrate-binding protein [Frateuria defendens]